MAPENMKPNGEPSDIQQNLDSNGELTETDFIEVIEALVDPDPSFEIEDSEYDIIETEGNEIEEDSNSYVTPEDDEEPFSEETFQEQMDKLTGELAEQLKEAAELDEAIKDNLESIGYKI